MASPRAYWTGQIRVSFVSIGVRLNPAASSAERIRLNQIHRPCNSRIRQPPTCPVHGQVDRSEIVKGYEFEKDRYVIVEQSELEQIKLRSEKVIELEKFVPDAEIDPVYLDSVYYAGPDGPVAREPFSIIRDALDESRTAGLGRITLGNHERAALVRVRGRGLTVTTLHAHDEVRDSAPYYEDVAEGPARPEHVKLASSLIRQMRGKFTPADFRDRYQDALSELVLSKVAGEKPVIIHEEDVPTPFNFMDALRKSIAESEAKKPPSRRAQKKPPAPSESAGTPRQKRKRA